MSFFEQVEGWEVACLIGGLVFLGFYVGQRVDWEDMLRPRASAPVHMEGKISSSAKLAQVEVLPIPDSVYTSLQTDTKFKQYLTGNQKYVFLFTYTGCPYARAFSDTLGRLFAQKNFGEYYRKHVIHVGRSTTVSCPGHVMHCATAWVYQTCFGNLCIFNPSRRQVVVDHSQNARQLESLLDKYKEW